MKKLLALFLAIVFAVGPGIAAVGSWNGVAFTAWNGVAQTSWNGTAISCASAGGTTFVTGQTLGTLRNDVTIGVGMAFTLAGSGVTVTHLGRWVVAGNSGTHLLQLLDTSGTVLGSVTVNTSGAPTATYLFGALGSPVALSASTQYVLTSDESMGGDQWYDTDTVVTYTAVVVTNGVTNASYAGVGPPTIFNNPDKMYVPVNFKY